MDTTQYSGDYYHGDGFDQADGGADPARKSEGGEGAWRVVFVAGLRTSSVVEAIWIGVVTSREMNRQGCQHYLLSLLDQVSLEFEVLLDKERQAKCHGVEAQGLQKRVIKRAHPL